MINDILMAIPLGILLCFMIGPVFFILLETAVTKGIRAAIVFDFGVILGDVVFIAIAYFSSFKLIEKLKDEPALFIFGGLIMITYGIISFLKLKKNKNNEDENIDKDEIIKNDYLGLFFKGFLLNFINVGVLGFWLLISITLAPKTDNLVFFYLIVIMTYFWVDLLKMFAAKRLKSKLTPKNILKVKMITSILLIVFGFSIMLQGWFPSDKKVVNDAVNFIQRK